MALGALVSVAVIAAAVAGVGWFTWRRINRVDLDLTEIANSEPQNFLIAGSDSREGIKRSDANSAVMLGADTPSGRRSDSIAILRVDPAKDRIDVLSIPRDLWVTLPSGEHQRINTAYSQSTQTLIDTIDKNLGIPIHHFVDVDFTGFQNLIDALGGVPMYFDAQVRDLNSGLRITTPGCKMLDGSEGLAFARSRHLEWKDADGWHSDGTGDLGRMTRQQLLMRAALSRVRSLGVNDVGRLKGLVDAGIDSTEVDSGLGFGDMVGLARHFGGLGPDSLQTHSLAVEAFTTDGGAAVLRLDEAASAPALDIFRGKATAAPVTTTTTPLPEPKDVTVTVLNGGGVTGEARRVSYVLSAGGFPLGIVDSAPEPATRTTVAYAPGGRQMAELVAGWLGPAPKLVESKDLEPGNVIVTIGSDFRTVDEPAGGTSHAATATTSSAPPVAQVPGGSDTASTAAPSTTTTTEPGWTPGVAPAGVDCG